MLLHCTTEQLQRIACRRSALAFIPVHSCPKTHSLPLRCPRSRLRHWDRTRAGSRDGAEVRRGAGSAAALGRRQRDATGARRRLQLGSLRGEHSINLRSLLEGLARRLARGTTQMQTEMQHAADLDAPTKVFPKIGCVGTRLRSRSSQRYQQRGHGNTAVAGNKGTLAACGVFAPSGVLALMFSSTVGLMERGILK